MAQARATKFGEKVRREANVRFFQALTKAQELEPMFRKALNLAPWHRRLWWAAKLIMGRF
jgi:hypothetical protein